MIATKKPSSRKRTPRLSAQQERAIREGWGPEDIACRNSQAKALRILRAHYRTHAPKEAGPMVLACRLVMNQAVIDLLALDGAWEGKCHESHYMMKNFAVFHTAEALQALHFLAWNSINSKTSPAQEAFNKGDELAGCGKLILHQIRERLRDGWNADEAVTLAAENIASMAKKGNAGFFADLGRIVRDWRCKPKRFQRTNTDWLLRMWLPLCLWECKPDGEEAEKRCRLTDEIINLPMPVFNDIRGDRQFLNAWRNVRSRVMKSRIPNQRVISHSATAN